MSRTPLKGVHEHRPEQSDDGTVCGLCGQALYSLRFGVWVIWISLETGQPCTENAERDLTRRAEEIHAEHHRGYIVPSLDSCDEHTRAEYEELVRGLRTATCRKRKG